MVTFMKYINKLREKIANGQLNFGTHCSCTDLSFYELCGQMDYDYVWIDAEHGAIRIFFQWLHSFGTLPAVCLSIRSRKSSVTFAP